MNVQKTLECQNIAPVQVPWGTYCIMSENIIVCYLNVENRVGKGFLFQEKSLLECIIFNCFFFSGMIYTFI